MGSLTNVKEPLDKEGGSHASILNKEAPDKPTQGSNPQHSEEDPKVRISVALIFISTPFSPSTSSARSATRSRAYLQFGTAPVARAFPHDSCFPLLEVTTSFSFLGSLELRPNYPNNHTHLPDPVPSTPGLGAACLG